MKTYELLNLEQRLNALPLGKLTVAQRAALTRTICAVSLARKPFDESLKQSREKLKPEGYDELRGKPQRTPEEDEQLQHLEAEYNEAVQAAMQPILQSDVTLSVVKPMTSEEFLALADCAPDMTAGEMMYVAKLLDIKLNGNEQG